MIDVAPSSNSYAKKSFWRKGSVALMASTLLLGSYSTHKAAIASPVQITQQQGWKAALNVARLVTNRQDSGLVLQLDILNKPQTSYANAVYQVFARRNSQWVQIYTSTGARLITSYAGQVTLAPEVISLSDLRRQLGDNVDLNNLELRVTTQLRYDIRGGQRDQTVRFEETQSYRTIAQTTSTQLVSSTSTSTTTTNLNAGNFSLAILQKQAALNNVIARVSVRSRTTQGFSSERFLGDFRYKINKKAKFVKGLKAGDRAIVRLFDTENQFIGYSEFELLSENSAVTLVLPNRPATSRIVRTIYGVDTNQDSTIDSGTQIYDYFTQVSQVTRQSYQSARVTFFSSVQSFNVNAFTLAGLPTPPPTCTYPTSFSSGSFLLVDRSIEVFRSGLSSALIALPGQQVQTINISSTNLSIYDVNQLFVTYQTINNYQGQTVVADDDDKKGRKKRHCNQGIGNGSEGCDPGNSHPHGSSNDEGGRKPGKRN